MIKLKDILNEDEVEDNFGKVAFGENPKIAKMQGKGIEKDTKFEDELIYILRLWISDSANRNVGISDYLYKNFEILKKARKIFPQIFEPKTPNGTEVFRGIKDRGAKWMEKLKNTNREKDWIEYPQMGGTLSSLFISRNPVKYTPHRLVQSWTSNKQTALSFGTSEDNPFDSVILTTRQNNEFLFNQDFIKYLYQSESGAGTDAADEFEILHFGNSFKDKVYVIVSDDFFDL